MARKPKPVVKAPLDRVQAKAKKQKRMAIILCGVLALVLIYEVPHTLKLMKKSPTAVVVSSSTTAPAPNPTVTTPTIPPAAEASEAASTPTVTTSIVASVQAVADPGQLTQFERFASKDPFEDSVVKTAPTAPAASSSAKTPATGSPSVPKAPPAPPPTTAVISLNGELMSVASGTDFPTSGTTFAEAGGVPIFHLLSLTQKAAKVTIAGGSYADGAPALTLTVGKAVTLQNTADGKQYTLILEPQGTQVPTDTTPTSTTPSAPSTTTPSVVPSSGG